MNKTELIDAISKKGDLKKTETARVVDSIIEAITDTLSRGEQVVLIGFGTFSVRDRAARTGRNPQTGEEIKIKASKNPVFKAGKTLKDAVN
ncbi:HU family DNA-binding protein [Candidatus Nitrosacidococcus sp. I8]|uniref:HU family DNA-binding protein n=1 Tax=Candidatus Nitrosacidococcus sp. I8 TaxID=2942908 RepID=UPI002225C5E7|nr:HU family DNA-binding protein [Candidatus Nitrosacidococcus sp. I8]CAH9019016.1 DNA-binding protein HU-beta [Candidatus Nitrosacidococcus sp. I8]